jgi:hypothetical protein
LAEFFRDGLFGAVDDVFGDGEDEELAYVVGEECVCYAVADALAAACYDGDFVGEVGGFGEGELMGCEFLGWTTEVLGDGVLTSQLVMIN